MPRYYLNRKKKGLLSTGRQNVASQPVVRQKQPVQTNLTGKTGNAASMLKGTVRNAVQSSSQSKPHETATQRAERERSEQMRKGIISSVARSQAKRSLTNKTYVNKSSLKPIASTFRRNPLLPTGSKKITGGHGIGEQRTFSKLRSFKQPLSEVSNYTKSQRYKYAATPSMDVLPAEDRKTKIDVEYGNKLRAGMPSSSNVLMSFRSAPTDREMDYRTKYGFDESFRQKQIEDRIDDSGITRDKVSVPKRVQAMHGSEDLMQAKEFTPVTWDDVKSGFADTFALKYAEDTAKKQFGIDVDPETLAKLEAQRATGGYAAGMMAGQLAQYGLTRGALTGLGAVGKGAKAADTAGKAFRAEMAIDQAASLPMNIIDAMKEKDLNSILKRFGLNQGLDLVFGAITEGISLKNNPIYKKAEAAHVAAKEAEANGDTAVANALNAQSARTLDEIPAEKFDLTKKELYTKSEGVNYGTETRAANTGTRTGEGEVRADVGTVQDRVGQATGATHLGDAPDSASIGRTGRTLSVTPEQRAVMDAAGKTDAHLREADYSAFSNALNEGRASNKYGSYVDPQDAKGLQEQGAKTFLSDDGSVGFAITKDGDMIGAFNRGGKYRGAVDDMLITARLNGGTKLDCYGAGLVNKYEQAGYVPVARIPFSAEYVNDPLLLANKPDVYVMMRNSDDIDTVIRKNANGEYKLSTQEELDALRTFDDYYEALDYRDDLLKNGENPKTETSSAWDEIKNEFEEPNGKTKAEEEPRGKTESKTEAEKESNGESKAEKEDTRTWQEKAREDYKTGKERAKAVKEGKIPSRENGEVANAIKRLKETKEFADIKDTLDRGVKDGLYNRKYRHLDEEIDKAIKEIEEDPEKVINEILEYHPNGAKANDVPADAIPWVMKGYALCKWAEQNGMVALKEDIAATMAKAQSAGGSILRAGQVFTVMADPKTQRDIVAEFVEKMQEKYAKRLGDHKLTVPEEMLAKLDDATTEAEKSKILDDITVHVWNQVPQNFIDAMGSLRIVSMLANTTTMIRNIASNVAFAGVREVDKTLNTAMESAAEKLGKIDREHRTHSIYNHFSKENRKIQAFWYNDYGKNSNIIKGQSRWDEGGGALNVDLRPQDARHFGIKAGGGRKGGLVGGVGTGIEGVRKATTWIMDKGDEMFLAPAYADAATQLMHIRGWGIDDLTPARMQEIRDYATLVAQKATYRDPSDMAMALAKYGHWQKGDGALRLAGAIGISGLQPFKKTPINIGKRAIEYSPIGFVKGIYDIRKAVQAGDSAAVNKAITELSKGTTGTGLVVAGYLLSEQGIINAQLPTDDEGYLRRDLGEQDYALNLGGKSRSLQWAAPGAIPILAGATLYDQVRQRGWNSLKNPALLVSVLAKSTNPILEMSFMQSYMDLIEATDDVKKGDKVWVGLEQIALSYASQFVPTVLGKIANTVDPVRRDTSSQSTDPYEKALQKAFNKNVINKTPWLSKTLPAYEDAFGNIQTTENMKDRIIQNFVSPWYTKEIKSDDPAFKELFRINDATPDTNLIPTNAIGKGKHELSLNGEKVNLDPHDMEEYKKIRGEGNQKALDFINTDEYNSMNDQAKAKALENIYDDAKTEAKQQMLLKKGKSEWDVYTEGFEGGKAEQIRAARMAGINAKDYSSVLTDKAADADGNGTYSKPEFYDYLKKQKQFNDEQRAILMTAKNKSWAGDKNPFITGEPPEGSKETATASNANYTDAIKSTGLTVEQFNKVTSADQSRIDANGSGRVSQDEYQAYLDSFDFLTNEQKSAIWKQYNTHWKRNPYDGTSTASSGGRRRSRSGRRSGGGSSKSKARAKTESEKRFANLQKQKLKSIDYSKIYSENKEKVKTPTAKSINYTASGLTKSQRKALLKLAMKKLNV